MRSEVAGNGPQAVWLSDGDESEADAFADPVLGRAQAAEWLEKRGQRREATRMRFTGSTQPRRAPTVVRTTIVRRISATPRPRATRSRVAQRSRSPGRLAGEPPPEPEPPLAHDWRVVAASVRMHAHVLRRDSAQRAAAA